MIDINIPLREAYITALAGLTYSTVGIKTYYQNAPDNVEDRCYVIMSPVASIGNGDKGFNQSATTMQVMVSTWNEKYNDGLAADTVAGQILTAIYPTPQARLELSAGYNTQINLVSDTTTQFKTQNQRNIINRIIIFRHQILN